MPSDLSKEPTLARMDEEQLVQAWLNQLSGLQVHTKKMFGCHCLYCDGQAVGWIHDGVLSLREVGLTYLPDGVKRPGKDDRVRELVIPVSYLNAAWLKHAVQDTADIRKKQASR